MDSEGRSTIKNLAKRVLKQQQKYRSLELRNNRDFKEISQGIQQLQIGSLKLKQNEKQTKKERQPSVPLRITLPPLVNIWMENIEQDHAFPEGHPLRDLPTGSRSKVGDIFNIQHLLRNVLKLGPTIDFIDFKINRVVHSNEGNRVLEVNFYKETHAKRVLKAFQKFKIRDAALRSPKDSSDPREPLPSTSIKLYAPPNFIIYVQSLVEKRPGKSVEERKLSDHEKVVDYFRDVLKIKNAKEIRFISTRIRGTAHKIPPLRLTFETLESVSTVLEANEQSKKAVFKCAALIKTD